MLKDGHYMAWFKTERGQGTGRVLLRDGKISGGDTVITYGGTYKVDGSQFTATLTTRRHAAGQPSVFGIDEVEIKLAGAAIGNFASCSGELEQVPGMLFQVTLIPVQEERKRPEAKFDPAGCRKVMFVSERRGTPAPCCRAFNDHRSSSGAPM